MQNQSYGIIVKSYILNTAALLLKVGLSNILRTTVSLSFINTCSSDAMKPLMQHLFPFDK